MNKKEIKTALTEVYKHYKDKGLLDVYLWGSITGEDSNKAADVHSVGIVDNSFNIKHEDEIKKWLAKHYPNIPNFGFRALYKSELDGGKLKGFLASVIHPKLLLYDLPSWKHVAGKEFAQGDFALPVITPQEGVRLRLKRIRDTGWDNAEKVPRDEVVYYLKELTRIVHLRQRTRGNGARFSYENILKNANEEEKKVLDAFSEIKSTDWDYDVYIKKADIFGKYVQNLATR